ncbi:Ribosome assembly protein 3 [Colletotrichum viniferum]|nr:Ribosome assembly protein 3 [Colletotrichum viniferum]
MSVSQEFTNFYLQRTTQEFAEDLDKVREADDFKAESLPFLIHALQQGTALYPATDQQRVMRPAAVVTAAADVAEDEDVDMEGAQPEKKKAKGSKKEKSKRKKSSG